MTVWQIAAGDWGRDYSGLCLKHDLMIIGPGNLGPYDYDQYISIGRRRGMISSFAGDVAAGDIVLLRRGYRVVGIGLTPEESGYSWDERFDDVYGWDLQHCRRIIWQHALIAELDAVQSQRDLFSGRKQIPSFSRVQDEAVLAPLSHLLSQCAPRLLRNLPDMPGAELSDEQVGERLFSLGLSQGRVEALIETIGRQRRMVKWYEEHGRQSSRPTEHEVVAYMVLPMLLALGWSEQLLAVEWQKVDMAAFHATPTVAQGCVLLCEAKGMWDGLQGSFRQAEQYVHKLGLTACRRILLTQGMRFYVHTRESNGKWRSEPIGYFNITRLRDRYVVPANTNAVDTLISLTPQVILGGQGL